MFILLSRFMKKFIKLGPLHICLLHLVWAIHFVSQHYFKWRKNRIRFPKLHLAPVSFARRQSRWTVPGPSLPGGNIHFTSSFFYWQKSQNWFKIKYMLVEDSFPWWNVHYVILHCTQYHSTLVCQVLARQNDFTVFHFFHFLPSVSGFHRGCTLGPLLATFNNWGNI